jgi:hypothetical protein
VAIAGIAPFLNSITALQASHFGAAGGIDIEEGRLT